MGGPKQWIKTPRKYFWMMQLRITQVRFHKANLKRSSLESLPPKVSCHCYRIIISNGKFEIINALQIDFNKNT